MSGPRCCCTDCGVAEPADVSIVVALHDDSFARGLVHQRCLDRVLHSSARPDDPADHGRIPAAARCACCGNPLPVVGHHPFSFDVGDARPPNRYWAHADCFRRAMPGLLDVSR